MKKYLVFIGIIWIAIACSKDSDLKEEMPFFSLLTLSGTSIDTVRNAADVWEYGFRFKTLQSGRITKLGIKVPAVSTFKVKLYDLTTQKILKETDIQSTKEGNAFFADIADISVNSGDEFGVAIVADVFFRVRNLSGEAFSFPILKDNISIVSFNENACGPNGCSSFPILTNDQVIAPCVDIVFVKD